MNVVHVTGSKALKLLRDPTFIAAWSTLLAACPWATAFQTPHFVRTWYAHYAELFEPWLVTARSPDGELIGLLTLGATPKRRFVVAGDWQAEYHAWISRPDIGDAFIVAALDSIATTLPIRFRYLPPGTPMRWLETAAFARRHALKVHTRPLYAIGDGSDARSSLKKSGNKKRLKTLAELGPVELRHVSDPEAAAAMDRMIPLHDARHAAVRGSAPFRNDPRKRAFYLGLLSGSPLLHMSALFAGDRLVAGHIGARTGADLQFGLLAHDPTVARASPGKFLIYHLAQRLAGEGVARFDLTAGGEAYKDRFANGQDVVHTLEVFPTTRGCGLAKVKRAAVERGRDEIERRGFSRDGASAFAHSVVALRSWFGSRGRLSARGRSPEAVGGLVAYHGDVADLPHQGATSLQTDDLVAFLDDAEPLSRWARRRFFSAAMRRMEMGQRCVSASVDGRLTQLAWIEREPPARGRPVLPCRASIVVWEFRVAPGANAANATRATLAAVRADAAPDERVCVIVDANDSALRRALEGFNLRAAGPVKPPAEILQAASESEPTTKAETPRDAAAGKKLVTAKKEPS